MSENYIDRLSGICCIEVETMAKGEELKAENRSAIISRSDVYRNAAVKMDRI